MVVLMGLGDLVLSWALQSAGNLELGPNAGVLLEHHMFSGRKLLGIQHDMDHAPGWVVQPGKIAVR
jgi:hypothetical protein